MADSLYYYSEKAASCSEVLTTLKLEPHQYNLLTVHRASNTDRHENLVSILEGVCRLGVHTVFPVHLRTRHVLTNFQLHIPGNIQLVEPVGYLDMLQLEVNAGMILTDSGGMQKEAYLLEVGCVTLREDTEWTDTVTSGWNQLVGCDPERLVTACCSWKKPDYHPDYFGLGDASKRISTILAQGW